MRPRTQYVRARRDYWSSERSGFIPTTKCKTPRVVLPIRVALENFKTEAHIHIRITVQSPPNRRRGARRRVLFTAFLGVNIFQLNRKTVRRKVTRSLSHTTQDSELAKDSCHMSPATSRLLLPLFFFLLLPTFFTHTTHAGVVSSAASSAHLNRTHAASIVTASQHPDHPPHACGGPPPAPPSPLTSIAGMCSAAMPRLVHTVECWPFQAGQRCGALVKHE
jgi:hypothetical protein